MDDREREAFEEWAISKGFKVSQLLDIEHFHERRGEYHNGYLQFCWEAWQARAALAASAAPVKAETVCNGCGKACRASDFYCYQCAQDLRTAHS
jgi:hypothetical protein